MDLLPIIIALVILVIAIVIATRKNQGAPLVVGGEGELEMLRKQKEELALSLARTEQQVCSLQEEKDRNQQLFKEEQQLLRAELEDMRSKYLEAEKSLEKARAFFQSQKELLEAQKQEIEKTKKDFNLEFQALANKILEEKTQKFTEANTKNLDQILNPLKEKLKTFEEKVEKTYQTEAAERNTLKGVVEQLMEQSRHIKDEASNLTRALKGDAKKQGNWGEVILERVLERSGLVRDREYQLQASMQDEDGRRLQPDAVIHLPDNKHLVVDSKVSLVAYERWINAETEEEKEQFAKQHILSVENHVKSLASKNYQELYAINSPDFVLLFMPIESAFSMSVTYKSELFSEAWDRRVVIVSPSTLLATLRTIASIWKQERQTRNVLEIAKEAGALYDKFVGFLKDLDDVGKNLERAQSAYTDARKKLGEGRGNIINKTEKLKTLGANATKQIDASYLDEAEQ